MSEGHSGQCHLATVGPCCSSSSFGCCVALAGPDQRFSQRQQSQINGSNELAMVRLSLEESRSACLYLNAVADAIIVDPGQHISCACFRSTTAGPGMIHGDKEWSYIWIGGVDERESSNQSQSNNAYNNILFTTTRKEDVCRDKIRPATGCVLIHSVLARIGKTDLWDPYIALENIIFNH